MYVPSHFGEDRLPVQHELILERPFALLISSDSEGILANPLPFVLNAAASKLGTLVTHMARGNEQWRRLHESRDVLVVFRGDDAYVSPRWYPSTAETGRVAPTWNYVMVQATGRPRVIHDTVWLRSQVETLTRMKEGCAGGAWSPEKAPADYLETMLNGIVGVEIEIASITGKWKASQNRSEKDRMGVVRGLEERGDAASASMAHTVFECMEQATNQG
jgi:transcriptional regulator